MLPASELMILLLRGRRDGDIRPLVGTDARIQLDVGDIVCAASDRSERCPSSSVHHFEGKRRALAGDADLQAVLAYKRIGDITEPRLVCVDVCIFLRRIGTIFFAELTDTRLCRAVVPRPEVEARVPSVRRIA